VGLYTITYVFTYLSYYLVQVRAWPAALTESVLVSLAYQIPALMLTLYFMSGTALWVIRLLNGTYTTLGLVGLVILDYALFLSTYQRERALEPLSFTNLLLFLSQGNEVITYLWMALVASGSIWLAFKLLGLNVKLALPVLVQPSVVAALGVVLYISQPISWFYWPKDHLIKTEPYQILTVWATWCKPCLLELQDLHTFNTQLKAEGKSIIPISALASDKPWKVDRYISGRGKQVSCGIRYKYEQHYEYYLQKLMPVICRSAGGAIPFSMVLENERIVKVNLGYEPLKNGKPAWLGL
jgi:hypothetical protein